MEHEQKTNLFFFTLLLCINAFPDACETLAEQRETIVESYGQVNKAAFSWVVKPYSEQDLPAVYDCARSFGKKVTVINGGWSFGDQFFPPGEEAGQDILLDVSQLKGIRVEKWNSPERSVTLSVGAGVTWGEAIRYVKEMYDVDIIPFDAPLSDSISISGSVVTHSASRSSDVTDHYSIDYVDSLTLVTPQRVIPCDFCSTVNSTENDEVCQWVPGSFGKLGIVSRLSMRFQVLHGNEKIITRVIRESYGLQSFVEQYLEATRHNHRSGDYDHGVLGQLQTMNEESGRGIVIGSRSSYQSSLDIVTPGSEIRNATAATRYDTYGSFPLFDGATAFNIMVYTLAHRFSGPSDNRIVNSFTRLGFTGVNKPFDWYFFHRAHAKTRELLSGNSLTGDLAWLAGVDSALRTAHQAWFIPGDDPKRMKSFIKMVWDTVHEEREQGKSFKEILSMLQMQDLVRIPRSRYPAHISHHYGVGHLYTLSLAIHSESEKSLAKAYLTEVSSKGFALGVQPYLLKENNVGNSVLRKSAKPYTDGLMAMANKVDPQCVNDSRLWHRLYPMCGVRLSGRASVFLSGER